MKYSQLSILAVAAVTAAVWSTHAHGLDNLQARLRALYGDRAGLELDRTPARMTVRLRITAA